MKNSQSGQIVIILLLIIVVALVIGLSISTRSITEVSTSTKTEQSSRAFSAAEAGIEKGLLDVSSNISGTRQINTLSNQANATVTTSDPLPRPSSPLALEYGIKGIGKENIAQVWMSNPKDLSVYYNNPDKNFDVYFGNPNQTVADTNPAIEVIVVTSDAGIYSTKRYFFDSYNLINDRGNNNFSKPGVTAGFNCSNPTVDTIISTNSLFYCVARVSGYIGTPIMVRIRMLYATEQQKVALAPIGGCGLSCTLPPQVRIIDSIGSAGSTQRRLQIFRQDYVIPPLFDYVLFSNKDISK